MSRAGTLVLLNGTSSSGKSTILIELQKKLPTFKFFKIDDWFPDEMFNKAKQLGWREENGEDPWLYLTKYVEQQTGRPNFDTETRAYLFREVPAMYQAAKTELESGSNVIVDTVLEYDPEYKRFTDFFYAFSPIKVLVYCRLDVLLARVHKRNKSGIDAEIRTALQSFEQFPAIYKLQEHEHEIIVDSVSSNSMKAALIEAIQDLINNHIPAKYLPALETFKSNFTKSFHLDDRNDINLVTRHPYDLVLDNSSKTPMELVQTIQTVLG